MRTLRESTEALQWIGLFMAPLAWAAQLILGYGATLAHCDSGGTGFDLSIVAWEWIVTAVAVLLALCGQAAAVAALRNSDRTGLPDERRRFFAQAAVLANVLFLLAILLSGITAATEAPICRQS
jgi:hypothetical protein